MAEQRPPERPQRKNGRPTPANGGLRFGRGLFGWMLFIGLAVMLFLLLQKTKTSFTPIAVSEFEGRLVDDKVRSATIEGDEITGDFSPEQNIPGLSKPITKFRTV